MATDALTERLAPYAPYVTHVRAESDGRPRLYVGRGRGSRWGNPHKMRFAHSEAERLRVVAAHLADLDAMDPAELELLLAPIRARLEVGGLLACWCAPRLCHAQTWAMLALTRRQ